MRASNETTIIAVSYNYMVDINIGDNEVNNGPVRTLRKSLIINKDSVACRRRFKFTRRLEYMQHEI